MYIDILIHQGILVVKKMYALMFNVDHVAALIIDSLERDFFCVIILLVII